MKRMLILACILSNAAALAQPGNGLKQRTIVLKRFLEKNHYQPLAWNDTSSAMLYNRWLEVLDDEKFFLLQKDVSALDAYKYRLDDELQGKDWNFVPLSSGLLKARLQRTDSVIKVVLDKPIDFSKAETFTWPFRSYAASEAEFSTRWRQYLKWRVMDIIAGSALGKNKAAIAANSAEFAKLELTARDKVRKQELTYIANLQKNPKEFTDELDEAYLNCIAWCYDPHTTYMNMKEKTEFQAQVSASEFSTGIDIEENEKGDKLIGYLEPGGSAWRTGQLHSGDLVMKIKINDVEKDISDLEEGELEDMLSSNSQENIELTVKTAAGEIKKVALVKEQISDDESIVKSYVIRSAKNYGYINLPGFYSREEDATKLKYDGCANDISKEIVKLKKDSIAGLILDLRYNGGGSMWEAMQLAGIFIDIGPVASMKDREGKIHFLKDPNRGTIYDGPLMILVNGGSASASEFVSAVLQDYNRALIVGSTTYGKGTAQIVLPLDTGIISETRNYTDFVKVTQEKFYRINGSTTQWKGVIPDINLPDLFIDDTYRESSNASALRPDNSKTGIYQALKPLPVAALKTKSEHRTGSDSFFIHINRFADRLKQKMSGRIIPLQWTAFSSYYLSNLDLLGQMNEDKKADISMLVTNNNFDRVKFREATDQKKEINESYIRHIQIDRTVLEAARIMTDWQSLQ